MLLWHGMLAGRGTGRTLFSAHGRFRLREACDESGSELRVMDKKRFYRRWKRQYARGLKAVRDNLELCRKTGSAEAVHELRVAIRRTRLLALMGRPVIGRHRVLEFRAWTQRLADALSPVRDYDVMIEWVKQASQNGEFVHGLEEDRKGAWRKARKTLQRVPPENWPELGRLKPSDRKRRKLAARYKELASATRELIDTDVACFNRLDSTARHDFRRAVRRLKYLVELNKKPARWKELEKLQGGLGELQNAETVKSLLENRRNHSARRHQLIRRVSEHETQWFTRCRRSLKGVLHMP